MYMVEKLILIVLHKLLMKDDSMILLSRTF